MKNSLSAQQLKILKRIHRFSPKDFDEYNRVVGNTMGKISEMYGLAEAKYSITPSPSMPFADRVPKSAVLFTSDKELSDKPCIFKYPFEDNGEICFYICFEKGKEPSWREQGRLNYVFRQLYSVLSSLILSFICRAFELTDPGTGIPNQEAFLKFGNELIHEGVIEKYTAFYFNIHNFKSVHKSLTYLEGNAVMTMYCNIVSNAVTKKEIVAHLGSDNFAALILNSNTDYFIDLIQNVVINYEKDGEVLSFMFGATAGMSKLSDVEHSGEIMLRISAAYQSAREDRVMLQYYNKKANLEIIEKKIILSKFMPAIYDREFFVVYQPKVDIKTRSVTGAEALVRWKSGDGFIMPCSFIPVLEKDGCITVLDFYVLEEVCRFQQKLSVKGIDPVKISVNFSKRHLTNNKLVEEIVEIIDRYGVPHEYIEVELTESEDFHNYNVMQGIVDELNFLGIKTSIDDFGTGYSSLGMLKTLRIDELKIDRSFIPTNNLNGDDRGILMLKGVVNLAKSLGLTIVAEGVETPEQLSIIENMECDIVQGYIFDKPLLEDEFIERLKQKYYVLSK